MFARVLGIKDAVSCLQERKRMDRKKNLLPEKEEEFRQQVEMLQDIREGGRIRGQGIQINNFHLDCAKIPLLCDRNSNSPAFIGESIRSYTIYHYILKSTVDWQVIYLNI